MTSTGAPATRELRILVQNDTTAPSAISHAEAQHVTTSVSAQAHEFARAWGLRSPHVRLMARSEVQAAADAGDVDVVIALMNNADQADALGYHSEDDNGVQYGRVFIADCLAAGVAWSSCLSHEVLEAIADVAVDQWVDAASGWQWALEVCDPVESDTYVDARMVTLSDYVLPSFFDQAGHHPFDRMGRLTHAFSLGIGGYAVVRHPQSMDTQQVFGDLRHYSTAEAWRLTMKATPLSRTARRLGDRAIAPANLTDPEAQPTADVPAASADNGPRLGDRDVPHNAGELREQGAHRNRSAVSGEFVTDADAAAHPDTTVRESD